MHITSQTQMPLAAPGSRKSSGEPTIRDQWLPTGEVAIPHPKPNFAPGSHIDEVTQSLESQWNQRLQGSQKCTVGILVERGWVPTEEHDEVLNIADAIMDAGGLPKLLYFGRAATTQQMKSVEALAVPGGRDVDPSKYGAKLGPHMDPREPDPQFDDFEIEAIRYAFDHSMPLLGHCRGAQIMNVAGGGTMTQDIPHEYQPPAGNSAKVNHRPEEVRHEYALRIHPAHEIEVRPGSRLHAVAGAMQSVNSVHHQCIAQLSPYFVAVATAPDGLIEGVERQGKPWQAGYQFHPEALRYTDSRYQGLYEQLVQDGSDFRQGDGLS